MIDRVVDLDIGERTIRTVCTVPKESPVFEGHFPGYPLLPGVLLIECMAQTTGWLAAAIGNFNAMPFLAGVKEGKFRTAVMPGDALAFEGKIVHEGSGFTVADCKGSRDDSVICDARLTFRVMPYPNPHFRQAFLDMAEKLHIPIKDFMK